MGHQHSPSTTQAGWIGTSTRPRNSTRNYTQQDHTTLLNDGSKACSTTAPTHTPHVCSRQKPRRDLTSVENERKRTPPHQEGHRHAEPFAAMPLQQKHSTRRSEQYRIRATRRLPRSRRRDNTTRGGLAVSAIGLLSSRLERAPHTGALPHQRQNSTPRIRLGSRRRSGEQRCPVPPGSVSTAKPTPQFDFIHPRI